MLIETLYSAKRLAKTMVDMLFSLRKKPVAKSEPEEFLRYAILSVIFSFWLAFTTPIPHVSLIDSPLFRGSVFLTFFCLHGYAKMQEWLKEQEERQRRFLVRG